MFKLRRPFPIDGYSRPVVWPQNITVVTPVDHGLDREDMTRLHGTFSLVLLIVGDIRRSVEEFTYAMTTIGLVDRAVVLLGDFRDHVTGLST